MFVCSLTTRELEFSGYLQGAPGMVLGAKIGEVISRGQKIGIVRFLWHWSTMRHCYGH